MNQKEKMEKFIKISESILPSLKSKCRKIFDRKSLDDYQKVISILGNIPENYFYPTPCFCMQSDLNQIIGIFETYFINNNKTHKYKIEKLKMIMDSFEYIAC